MSGRVLFVQHDHASPPGLIGEAFARRGFDVHKHLVVPESRFHSPDVTANLPDLAGYDVVVVMGAVWGVYDEAVIGSWLIPEKTAVSEALTAGTALLGLCFGGQLLADILGGTVSRSPAPELGWTVVHTDEPDLVPAGPWFQYHFDRWVLPAGAREVARNASASQAFVHGRALGVQFHPELDAAILEGWLALGGHDDLRRAGLDAHRLLAHTAVLDNEARGRADTLVGGFLDRVATQPLGS